MNKNLLLAFILAFVTAAPLWADTDSTALADDTPVITVGNFQYKIYSDGTIRTAHLVGHTDNSASEIAIPASIQVGSLVFTVTEIGKDTFNSHTNLTIIMVPEGVISIEQCFTDCPKLENLILPKSLRTIGDNFLMGSSIRELQVNSVDEIGRYAFANDVLENLQLKNEGQFQLHKVDPWSFAKTNLEEIIIPETVTHVEECAFEDNAKLRLIKFGSQIQSFSAYLTERCPNLTTIELNTMNPPRTAYESIMGDWFFPCFSGSYYYLIPKEAIPAYKSVQADSPYGFWQTQTYYAIEDVEEYTPKEIVISQNSVLSEVGTKFQLNAGYSATENSNQDLPVELLPQLSWEITNESILSKTSCSQWTGKISGSSETFIGEQANFFVIGEGECDIIVTVNGFPGLKAICHVDTHPSGINNIDREDAPQDVYNLQGVRVKAAASKADVDALPAGIYIVGGKKIVKTN